MEELAERPLYQLLLAEPSSLTCEECFAVMEYYFETLGNDHDTLFSIVEQYLENCPVCVMEQHLALYREMVDVEGKHSIPDSVSFEHSQNGKALHLDPTSVQPPSNDHSESLSNGRVKTDTRDVGPRLLNPQHSNA